MGEKVRVRYAPSPTGYLHIGGARSALFNYLYAKKYNGDFVFRIEDTDIERNIPGAEESQLHDLIWLGIVPDESPENPNPKYAPYRQMEKLDIYKQYAQKLIDMGVAYECYCSEEELAEMKEEQLSNGVKSFKYMLTESTPLGFMRKLISSENTSPPAGMHTLSSPPNVTRRALCKLISLSPMARARVTRESVTGSPPQLLEKCSRTRSPPRAQVTG